MIDSNASSPITETCGVPRSYRSLSKSFLLMRNKGNSSIFSSLAQRLRFRKDLHLQRRAAAILGLLFAFIGLILAILEIELSIIYCIPIKNSKFGILSFVIKSIITISTLFLLVTLVFYHYIDMKIQMQKYNIGDQNVIINCLRICKLLTEIIICSFHPPLGINGPIFGTGENNFYLNSIDGIMSILMFLRFYLLVRVLILCSSLHQDTLAQSFGAINQTSLNTIFIFKSWIHLYAGYFLSVITIFVIFWGGWSLRVCEMYTITYLTFSNSLWLTGVTFLTIGYGDIVPNSACGKSVAIIIGSLGAGCTALVVAIVANKLELTQTERYLHNFVQSSELNNKLDHESANILKFAWKIHKCKQSQTKDTETKTTYSKYYQRQLLLSVRRVRQIRTEKRQLLESSVGIFEVKKAQNESHKILESLHDKILKIEKALETINLKLEKR